MALKSPYFRFEVEDLKSPAVINTSGKSPLEVSRNSSRLSVTGMLVGRWCELKTAYEAYTGYTRFSANMAKGTAFHSKIELTDHPVDPRTAEMKLALNISVSSALERFADDTVGNIERIVHLMLSGSARELKIHGFVGKKTGNLLMSDGLFDPLESLVLTGVIDHLEFLNNSIVDFEDGAPETFEDVLCVGSARFSEALIRISDLKTRGRPTLPTQQSVLDAAKTQVMLYRAMLDTLLKRTDTFYLLCALARSYKIDIDEPLLPLFAVLCVQRMLLFAEDFKRLMTGEFSGWDMHSNYTSLALELLTVPRDKVSLCERMFPEMVEYVNKPWKQPLTVRYLLYVYSNLLRDLGKMALLSEKLRIEYVTMKGRQIGIVEVDYSKQKALEASEKGSKFWLGARAIDPVDYTYKNYKTYCKNCEFVGACHWVRYHEKKQESKESLYVDEVTQRQTDQAADEVPQSSRSTSVSRAPGASVYR